MSEVSTKSCGSKSCNTAKSQSPTYTPRVDVVENEDAFLLFADLPGVASNNLDIRFEDGELTIHGKVEAKSGDVTYLAREYGVGDYVRRLKIDGLVDVDKIDAELEDGVLKVELPKSEAAKPRKIEVRTG